MPWSPGSGRCSPSSSAPTPRRSAAAPRSSSPTPTSSPQSAFAGLCWDELAVGFARDLGKAPPGVRSRMMAAIAWGGMVDVWNDWIAMHAGDAELDFVELNELKAEYLEKALKAGLKAVEMLPDRHG